MLEAFSILLLLAAFAVGWLAYQGKKNAARLRELSRNELNQVRGEHEKHVKRLQRKLTDANSLGHLDFAADLLPVLDALGIAVQNHATDSTDTSDADDGLRSGLKLVARELDAVLERHGISRCDPEPGAPFDPQRHEAVAVVEGVDAQEDAQEKENAGAEADVSRIEPGHVVECFRPGYVHGERVLRPAAVSVAAQPK